MSAIDQRHYIKTFHDFDIFKGCFGNSKIMPSDIDFIVERKNNFLMMEFKPEDKAVFYGQELLLQRLSRVPKFTVVLVFHSRGRTLHEKLDVKAMKEYPNGERIEANNKNLIIFVTEWYAKADKG